MNKINEDGWDSTWASGATRSSKSMYIAKTHWENIIKYNFLIHLANFNSNFYLENLI